MGNIEWARDFISGFSQEYAEGYFTEAAWGCHFE